MTKWVAKPVTGPLEPPAVIALSGQQEQIVALLLTGSTQRDAAATVGVAEETVSRWVNHDPDFIATMNARRVDVWRGNVDRLRALTSKAIETIETVLEQSPDERVRLAAAVAVLRAGGLAQLEPPAATDTTPEDVETALRRARSQRATNRMLADLGG